MSHDNPTNDPMNFVKNMWGNMGFSLPGMVTPTFDVEEIEKKVKDMKAVEGWLKMNLSMLQMTIQSLEMQCVTLNAVRTMSNMATSHASAAPEAGPTTADAAAGEGAAAQPGMWPWNLMQQMQDQMQQAAAEQAATSAAADETNASAAKRSKKAQ